MIAKLDVAVRQVLIEARIVEATDTFGKSLGVKLGTADLRGVRGGDAGYAVGNGGNRIALGGNYNAIGATTGAFESSGLSSLTSRIDQLAGRGLRNWGVADQFCSITVQFGRQSLSQLGDFGIGS